MLIHQKYKVNKRWGYDRKESKDHGVSEEAWLVGELKDNDRVILVDDVITTGYTKIKIIEKLETYSRKAKLRVEGVIIFLDRQEKDEEGNNPLTLLEEKGLKVYSILKIREIIEVLKGTMINNVRYREFQDYFTQYGT
jgi:orotate phosphoribosyltransferase